MTYLEIVQQVCERIGIPSPSTLAGVTDPNILIMMDLVNEIYQGVAYGGEGDEVILYQRKWWWLETDTRIELFPTYKTGTVSGSAGGDTLTFVASTLQTAGVQAGDRIQKIGDTQFFDILTVDGETQVTITSDLPEEWATGSTFRIVRPYYDLPADFVRTRVPALYPEQGGIIEAMPWQDYQRHIAQRGQPILEGSPCRYSIYGTGNSRRRIWFDKSPDKAYDVIMPYEQTITELAADGDVPLVPTRYQRLFVHGTAARFLLEVLDDTGGEMYERRYRAVVAAMVNEQDQAESGDLQLAPDMSAWEAQIDAAYGGSGTLAERMAYKDNS